MKRPYYDNFAGQRRNAKRRNIEFQFTYEDWLDWWGPDIINRGTKRGQLVMARKNDAGPYNINNVFKCETSLNVSDGNKGRPLSEESRLKRSISVTESWKLRKEYKCLYVQLKKTQ